MNFYYKLYKDNIWIKCENYRLFLNDKQVALNELCLFDNIYAFQIEYIVNNAYKAMSNVVTCSNTNNGIKNIISKASELAPKKKQLMQEINQIEENEYNDKPI
eukprot:499869_1